jgi:hypothetical protein
VRRRTLMIALHGVLLGSGFMVNMACTNLHHAYSFIDTLAQQAALAIVEHISSAAWPLLREFVLQSKQPASSRTRFVGGDVIDEESSGTDDEASRDGGYPPHSFFARWAPEAEELINDAVEAAVEIV